MSETGDTSWGAGLIVEGTAGGVIMVKTHGDDDDKFREFVDNRVISICNY